MKKSNAAYILLFVTYLLYSDALFSQENADTAKIWRIETSDGNEFFGAIVSKDSVHVLLRTDMLGVITIPVIFISSTERKNCWPRVTLPESGRITQIIVNYPLKNTIQSYGNQHSDQTSVLLL
jgi:hypothetical protein